VRGAGAGVWRVADPSARSFGDEVPSQILSDATAFMTPDAASDKDYISGLVLIDKFWTFCQLVNDEDRDAWESALVSGHKRDSRVTGDVWGPIKGQRFLSFTESLGLQRTAPQPPFPLGGQRAAHEFTRALRATGMERVTHHLDFDHKSGISPNSNITRAHRRITDALHDFQQQDQLKLPSLAGVEVIVRYLVQIELAVGRKPRSPDFQDFDAVVAPTVTEHCGLFLSEHSKHTAQIQKGEAAGKGAMADEGATVEATPRLSLGLRRGRARGDPFPLPLLDRTTPTGALPGGISSGVRWRCNQTIMALNDLGAPLVAARRLASAFAVNAAQASVLQRGHQRVAAFGDPLGVDGDEALLTLLKTKDMYSARPTPVRSYEPHLLKVLDSGIRPLPFRSLAPASLLPLIEQPERYLYRSQAVLDTMVEAGELAPARPFWGANLRGDPTLRLDLSMELMRIGIFFVGKRDGTLRMAIDGRGPSAMHRRPPRTELGSAAALSGLCLDGGLLGNSDSGHHGASADLRQGFYQMRWLEVGSWFCFDCPMAVRNFDTDCVYDEASREHVLVDPDTIVHPCFQGLAMGWRRSLLICNAIAEDVTRIGIGQVLSIPASDARIVSERAPCARLVPGDPAGSSCVGNSNAAGSPRTLVDAALEAILREFERRGLSCHE
ncbi:unnamed protein product, partial [Prorocentrum cordatum]